MCSSDLAWVWDAYDANIGLDGGERVISGEDIVLGERIKEGRLTHVWKTNDSDSKAHEE